MTASFADQLSGGHHNSLGNTGQVVALVLSDRARLATLFDTVAEPDPLVRMRVGDALEKVCRKQPGWFVPYVDRILDELGAIDQPSVQWHVAQLLQHLRRDLTDVQLRRAVARLEQNLARSSDWIVLNVTMDVLTEWAEADPALAGRLRLRLEQLRDDRRRSVAKRATARLARLGS